MKAGHIKEPSQPDHSRDSDSRTPTTRDCHCWDQSPFVVTTQVIRRVPTWLLHSHKVSTACPVWHVSHSRGLDVSFHKAIYLQFSNAEAAQGLRHRGCNLDEGAPGLLSPHSPSVPKSHCPLPVFGSGCVSLSILSIHLASILLYCVMQRIGTSQPLAWGSCSICSSICSSHCGVQSELPAPNVFFCCNPPWEGFFKKLLAPWHLHPSCGLKTESCPILLFLLSYHVLCERSVFGLLVLVCTSIYICILPIVF